MWILGWGAEHVPRLLTGRIGWSEFWNANIFHPEPLALALSEHCSARCCRSFRSTGSPATSSSATTCCSFPRSRSRAFGTYLLVRDLTGDKRAAFIAGLVYGISAVSNRVGAAHAGDELAVDAVRAVRHQSLRHDADRRRALVGGTAALVMQNWSCGYYLLYFAPFVPLFVVHRLMWTLGTLARDLAPGLMFAGAAAAVDAGSRCRSCSRTTRRSACSASSVRSARSCGSPPTCGRTSPRRRT